MDCIFCSIIKGQIPSDIVYQDDDFVAFRDIHPQAPIHILIIPRVHIVSTSELADKHMELMGKMILTAKKIAEKQKISVSGYRLTFNTGPDGTQVVPHIHLHLLGGRRLSDDMG
jgi:histidine triad (HIT) family protein